MQRIRERLQWQIHKNIIVLFFLGFSAGLPIMLVFSSLSFWLREADVSRSTIGFFSWVGLAYGLKWLWSPLVDQMPLPFLSKWLGRRRAWLLLSQIAITLSLTGMAITDPTVDLWSMALFATLVAFSSATQDIVIDAYRIEVAGEKLQAALAASYMTGYRLAMILATAGVLSIAAWLSTGDGTHYELFPWQAAYFAMACCMIVGICTTFMIKEPKTLAQNSHSHTAPRWLEKAHYLPKPLHRQVVWFYGAVICPFTDFIQRYRWHAFIILALISTYRISDIVMGIMANPFYVDLGYTKEEVATITKVVGVIMTLTGAALSGTLMIRTGVMKVLFVAAVLVVITNLMFSGLAIIGHNLLWFTVVIVLDSLAGGMAASAFIAYLSSLTNVHYSATQYALFSSVMLLFPKFIAGFSGVFVDNYGYALFFMMSALMGLPTLVLVVLTGRHMTFNKQDAQGS